MDKALNIIESYGYAHPDNCQFIAACGGEFVFLNNKRYLAVDPAARSVRVVFTLD